MALVPESEVTMFSYGRLGRGQHSEWLEDGQRELYNSRNDFAKQTKHPTKK